MNVSMEGRAGAWMDSMKRDWQEIDNDEQRWWEVTGFTTIRTGEEGVGNGTRTITPLTGEPNKLTDVSCDWVLFMYDAVD